ncbi:hypothetical protein ACEPXS_31460, partial [Pseudomonas aeruginosa]
DFCNRAVILSRRRGESYEDFIERICVHPLARKIKLADIEDNLNVLRLASLGESDLRRVSKYHQAWKGSCRDKGKIHSLPSYPHVL